MPNEGTSIGQRYRDKERGATGIATAKTTDSVIVNGQVIPFELTQLRLDPEFVGDENPEFGTQHDNRFYLNSRLEPVE